MTQEADPSPSFASLLAGDPAPWFHQNSSAGPDLAFHALAGRYVVLCFYGSANDKRGRAAIDSVLRNRRHFDDLRASFLGVSTDPGDESKGRVRETARGIRFLWDWDFEVSRLYGAVPKDAQRGRGAIPMRRFWAVLDPTLRVQLIVPFAADGSDVRLLFAYLENLPPPARFAGVEIQAPVLFLPNIFEPELCRHLIGLHEASVGEDSGFMRDVDGKTVRVLDHRFKRRRDFNIEDRGLMRQLDARIVRRICPEVLKVFSYKAMRIERYTIGCYVAEEGGHFRAHRDNTAKGTAHRQFAISINLNSDFEGGALRFPEYGPRSFSPPAGGAVVFSCSLLHAVSRVTKGRRYAFIPFLYDDEAARLREANNLYLGPGVDPFKPE